MRFEEFNFSGKKALVRVDFNVPVDAELNITDDTRIRAALPTITKIISDGGAVIIMSHLGRPLKGPEDKYSLRHLIMRMEELLNDKIAFSSDCIGEETESKIRDLPMGNVLLLENTRFYREEKSGDREFARQLAELGDVYVNDAFGSAHRAHASTAVIAEFFESGKKFFGLLMEKELKNADKVLYHAEKPFTAILGGAKVSDKIPVFENLLDKVDNMLIGGGMAYTFLLSEGGEVGGSLIEENMVGTAKSIIDKALDTVNFYLPPDSKLGDEVSNSANMKISSSKKISAGWMGLDIGPKAVELFSAIISSSKTILWNGPMGVFELENFSEGTSSIAKAVAEATAKGAYSLVGGGDSVAAVKKLGYENNISYISTGGGALLEYLEGKQLPGVVAIRG